VQSAQFHRVQCVHYGRAALILNCIGKGPCETHGKGPRIRFKLVVGLRAGLRVFDGDFYNECSAATDVLLGLGDLCSQVIRVERRHLDVHAFCHRPSQAVYLASVFSARSASVSHLSAISMKNDRCTDVRAATANRMHSAALLRDWTKLETHQGLCSKNESRSEAEARTNERRAAKTI
jgi:hypothetical protein